MAAWAHQLALALHTVHELSLKMYYHVAGIDLDLSSNVSWALDSSQDFVESAKNHNHSTWQILPRTMPMQYQSLGKLLFDSQGSWAAYATNDPHIIEFILYANTENGREPQAQMQINDLTQTAEIAWLIQNSDDHSMQLTFPFDELFFINAFALSQTLLIHSLTIEANGLGYLFCGVSGAGKSTLGQILENRGYHYLCDERNALSLRNKNVIMSSTPFYGTSEKAYKGSAPLKAIIVLDPAHGKAQTTDQVANTKVSATLKQLSSEQAISQIYPTIFLPQFSRQKIELTLDTLDEILKRTPVYQLSYDKSQVDIADFLSRELFCQV